MPKSKNCRHVMVTRWVASVQDYYIIADEGIVYCKACNKEVRCERKSQVRQHVNTAVHKRNVDERNRVTASSDVQSTSRRKCQFYMDMCQAMIAANMPWHCLDNRTWRNFLQKYTNQYIPNESIIRQNYLRECYNHTIQNIKKNIADDYVWISVHETAGINRMTNLMIGKLSENERTRPYLLACNRLQATNDATIARFVNSAIRVLWPNGGEEKILLFITDATPCMLEAGNHLKVFYPNILHVTCLASELNRVVEKVRLHFPSVDKLISSVRRVFHETPLRLENHRSRLKSVSERTKRGTWLEAAFFYATHLDEVEEAVESFDDEEWIESAKEALRGESLRQHLTFIYTHFQILSMTLKKLETFDLPLSESVDLVIAFMEHLKSVPGDCGEIIAREFKTVLQRNGYFNILLEISNILKSAQVKGSRRTLVEHWGKFKYAPVTSGNVERFFPAYKLILTDERYRLTPDNVEQTIVAYCNCHYNL